jgi:hypothetical protein
MGTLKLEIDIPDFKNEINLNITIRKDGEVVSTLSADQIDQSINTPTTPKKRGTKTTTSINAGNLMNMDY